jgi:hypothetical protein
VHVALGRLGHVMAGGLTIRRRWLQTAKSFTQSPNRPALRRLCAACHGSASARRAGAP